MAQYQGEKRDYDFVAPVTQESECSVCLQSLQDPQLVSCCGNNFCRACISRIQNDHKPCPWCKQAGFTTMANQDLKRALNSRNSKSSPSQAEHYYELVAVKSQCSVCLQTLQIPHLVSCCGHNFCEACIRHIQRDHKPCPVCKQARFTTMENKSLKRAIKNSKVRCPHCELGCEWVDELGKLNQHLNANPHPKHKFEGCPFTLVKCIHCKNHMRRHVLAGHQNECPKRPYTCEYCKKYKSTFDRAASHWDKCEYYLPPCPNNCGSGIKRQNVEHHVKKVCPLTVVECDFHYAGCGVKLPRKDMAVHMKDDSVAHISLLAAENQRLAKQLLKRDEKMQQLMRQLLEKDEQLLNQQTTQAQQLSDLKENMNQKFAKDLRELEENTRRQFNEIRLSSQRNHEMQEDNMQLKKIRLKF